MIAALLARFGPYLVVLLVTNVFTGWQAYHYVQTRWDDDKKVQQAVALAAQVRVDAVKQQQQTINKAADQLDKSAEDAIKTQTVTIIKKVPVYVTQKCPVPASERVLLNAAATGAPGVAIPPPPSGIDAAPNTATELAATVAANYGRCRQNAQQLIDLQNWIRETEAVNP